MTFARPTLQRARRVRATVATIAACSLTVVGVFALTGELHLSEPSRTTVPDGPTPWDYTVPSWDEALGGDAGLTADSFTALSAYADTDLGADVSALRSLASSTALADLTGEGRDPLAKLTPDGLAPYWPEAAETAATTRCSDVTVKATSPAALPVSGSDTVTLGLFDRYAKALVAFTGTCGEVTATDEDPAVTYVYAGHSEDGTWVPLRAWQVPVTATLDQLAPATEPYEWELSQFTGACAPSTVVRDRISVVSAFEQMCDAAAADGVSLKIQSGYRTRAEQALVFAQAVDAYGSTKNARRYVAYADEDVCTSKHCSGLAVTVLDTPAAVAWLTQTVGCVDGSGQVTAATSCASGTTAVANLARWGFAQPLASSHGYLEFVLPLQSDQGSSLRTPNCNPVGLPVANQVAAVFRCRLAREGVVGAEQDEVVAQALTISRCESGWNPSAAAFAGRFATVENPVTGRTYTQRGVFMIAADTADAGWVIGGSSALDDPVANINAAASLWLATRGWEQFGCATGADPQGFEAGPVLQQFGGPELPEWSRQY